MIEAAQRKSGGAYAPKLVHDVLRQPGQPLERNTRAAMESRFGRDFSGVRVHTGDDAERATAAVGADAWTVGRHVAFRHPQIAPRLLAHELGHVVQQRNAGAAVAGSLEIGGAHDHFERDADAGATAVVTGAPRLQRGFLDVLRDIVLFIPRLFGAGGYTDDELKEYVQGLKKRRATEGGIFSDNKARGAVASEKSIGPFDRDTKILLIEEMLAGNTSIFDENSIIDLLRRQQRPERDAIVQQIGREKIWSNFGMGNRRIVEALTLTAADANDALESRLRSLDEGQLADYAENADDPAVKNVIERVKLIGKITAPVPGGGTVTAPAPNATLPGGSLPRTSIKNTIHGVDIYALPDLIDPTLGRTQYTDFYVNSALPSDVIVTTYADGSNAISKFDPPKITAWIRTRYAAEDVPAKHSGYGVGSEEKGTLKEHEASHGRDYYEYLKDVPPPAFGGQIGMTRAAFEAEVEKYRAAVGAWIAEAQRRSIIKTDCANPLHRPTDADLAGTGYTASICNQN